MSNDLIKRLRDAVSDKYDWLGDVDWDVFSRDLIDEADAYLAQPDKGDINVWTE